MQKLSTDEIRQKYLAFFRQKNHAIIPGASLIPENDPTVLFTTAGMHPLVPYLLGEPHPQGRRLANVQRCVRTQDIDEVGDASHLTFFEMLGNWSLGDYFKDEAIRMSFEFLTSEQWLGIPVDMLAVSCFAGDRDAPKDEESATVWERFGIPRERIAFLPKAKNWWGPAGETGPCGPDTEMFTWIGKGKPQGNPATHEAEWLEIWNDVFMQYNRKEAKETRETKEAKEYAFEPLKQKNVDTGMGLERVAAVMQGVNSVYETDRMNEIAKAIRTLWKPSKGEALDYTNRYLRIIIDHLRAATFIIADGIKPSNVDQGYVLRRLIRRSIRAARQINVELGCGIVAAAIIEQYSHVPAYAHLQVMRNDIVATLSHEENQFAQTLKEGVKHLRRVLESVPPNGQLEGDIVFHLYDTYGFPIELTKEIVKETDESITIDEQGFRKAFAAHQKLSRAGAEQRFKGGLQDHSMETTKLHTATHLLNAALRKVLGDHVYQKGSNITAERLRFDFSHPEKMTPEQIAEVERLVNKAIHDDLPISYHVTTVDGAKAEGAIGVFDARYGNEVKVYVVGDAEKGTLFSQEICGGPHVARTGMLGSLTIQKEESSSAGVRRVKAVIAGGPTAIETAREKRT